jgi:hypothetical protein
MENKEKVFANGIIFKRNDNAPSFAIGKLSFKVEEAISFLQANEKKGWVNLAINQSQNGKFYIELDTWEAKSLQQTFEKVSNTKDDNSPLPF